MEMTMLVAVGKGIELEVDVTRLNNEVRDLVMRSSLRNLLISASRPAFDAAATSGREMTAFRASRKMTIATGSVGAFGPPIECARTTPA